jgi:Uma2 family endonuclease
VDTSRTAAEADYAAARSREEDEPIDAEPVARRSARVSRVSVRLLHLLEGHCEATQAGWVFDSLVGCDWFDSEQSGRIPNVSFIGRGRLKGEAIPDGDLPIPPDFAAVIASPGEGACAVFGKVEAYLAAGVRLVWVIDPKNRLAMVHRCNGTMVRVRDGEDLDGEDVIPGFLCPLAACLPLRGQEAKGPSGQGES